MAQEIKLHRGFEHENIVKFISSFQGTFSNFEQKLATFFTFFSDPNYVFIVLEICKKKSMMELHKRRGPLTEPEVRYYMKQLCEGIGYLHDRNIIHRDLKVSFLSSTQKTTKKSDFRGIN